MIKSNITKSNITERPPIVAVMGHIDHGKSALLDFIRKSNIVEGEAGGITQHISAYEVIHKTSDGKEKKITFLDTPGHEAFTAMRSRGANIADIAILIISAEEGPKPQTIEAYKSIKEAGIPFVVAINKIDKPGADVEKTKQQLIEKEIYLEGYGGDIPFAPISAKTGQGVPELLDTVLLVAELEELKGDPDLPAEGFVLESSKDFKKGINATFIITNGSLKIGDFVVSENKCASVRAMENFFGKPIKEAVFSSPVKIGGFKETPATGSIFATFHSKKEAEKMARECESSDTPAKKRISYSDETTKTIIPLIIKADVLGTVEAIQHELAKINNDKIIIKTIFSGVGDITENDIQTAGGNSNTLVAGFNVKIDKSAKDMAEKTGVVIGTFNIIYKLTEWLEEEIKKRTPKIKIEKTIGKAKIIRVFSRTKNKQVLGGKVLEGSLSLKSQVKISRRENEIDKGTIFELQSQKIKTKEVREGEEFGAMVEAKKEISPGDVIEAFIIIEE
ncbi:translation initiation factor IF-2 [Candidatus Parcubacteria bacterium]|nr:translation initiation factor IF-2 [Candidatus Parcubacteria bacterium]